jgi:hypothetical protein
MNTVYKIVALAQSKVTVWYREDPDPIDHVMDYGGIIEGHSPVSIMIAGARFVREIFEFRACIK